MKISTKGRYALRSITCLAKNYNKERVSIKQMSKRHGISDKYLENILRTLVSTGIVKSSKGKGGGFELAKHPSKISVYDVLITTEGSLAPVSCVDNPSECKKSPDCETIKVWIGLDKVISKYLKSLTLSMVIKGTSKDCF